MPEPYSNRELDEKFADIKDSLNRIEEQTKKTNGSVANLKMWKAYTTGAIAVIMFLLTVVLLPLGFAIIQNGNHL